METSSAEIPKLPTAQLGEASWAERVLTGLGSGLDGAMLQATQFAVDSLMMPKADQLPELKASGHNLRSPELLREPKRFFEFGNSGTTAIESKDRYRRTRPRGVMLGRELCFEYENYTANGRPAERIHDRILLEHWMHDAKPARGTVLAVHGFTMGWPRIDGMALFAKHWFQHGLDVVLVTLPHHGPRTPDDARFSGEHFAVPNMERLAEAVRQAVFELRLLVDWLRDASAAPVGLLGLSLGGYLSALMAGLYDDLDFVVPMVPPACMGDLAWRFYARSRRHRELVPAFSLEELRESFRVHSPLAHDLKVPSERVLIIAGRGDRIVPPEHPHALWEHWQRPAIHWFNGGHLAPFGRQRIVSAVVEHLRKLDVL